MKISAKIWLFQLMLAGIAAGVALLGAEVILRLRLAREVEGATPAWKLLWVLPDSERAYGLRPGVEKLGYRISVQGFRGPDVQPEKPAGVRRIISLGDSVGFGMGVKDETAILPRLLEAELNRLEHAPVTWQVINAGVPGYNTHQEWAYLRDELLAYEPDIVLVNICLNDADPVELEYDARALVKVNPEIREHDWSLRTLVNQSYVLRALKSRILSLHPGLKVRAVNQRVRENAWAVMKQKLVDMHRLAETEGVRGLFVVYPWRAQLGVPESLLKTQQDLAALAEAEGMSFLDLTPAFTESEEEELFLQDGVHPTPAGHRIAAREIGSKLSALGWVGVERRDEG